MYNSRYDMKFESPIRVVAITLLGALAVLIAVLNIDHGLLKLIIIAITGLAGYEIIKTGFNKK